MVYVKNLAIYSTHWIELESTMSSTFVFNEEYRLLLCKECNTALPPTPAGQTRHLRLPKHGYRGAQLKTLMAVFAGYEPLRSQETPPFDYLSPIPAVEHLRVEQLYACMMCDSEPFTKVLNKIGKHISSQHSILPKNQVKGVHWKPICGQTFYSEKKYISYFEVQRPAGSGAATLDDNEDGGVDTKLQEFLDAIAADERERVESLRVVEGFDAHKSEVKPWLQRTGIAAHLKDLPEDKIIASYSAQPDASSNFWIAAILKASRSVLKDAYKATQPPNISYTVLKNMVSGAEGKSHDFRHQKAPQTITNYFKYWKQFMIYVDRFMFTDNEEEVNNFWFPDGDVPDGVLIPRFQRTQFDVRLYTRLVELCHEGKDNEEDEEVILKMKSILPRLFYSLITTAMGPNTFSSPLMSYSAMLALKPSTKAWKEGGDFSSNMSGIIWVSQLLLLYYCKLQTDRLQRSAEINGESSGHTSLNKMVKGVFNDYGRHESESPLGSLLNWRDLAIKVSLDSVQMREAIWNPEQTVVTYGGLNLRLTDVTKILKMEYTKAHRCLYNELLFGGEGLERITGTSFTDNLRHRRSRESMLDACSPAPSQTKLIDWLIRSKSKRQMLLSPKDDGKLGWNSKNMAHYESLVQKFLEHLLVLIHIGSGQPLRSPEILSTKWQNTQSSARSLFILHERVMLRISYHKGLQNTGRIKDNMRFLPPLIGNLLLEYLVYVQPLRQKFQQQTQGKDLSPFLWSCEGKTWDDGKVTDCLKAACARAEAPKLKVGTWRQITVAIVKAKFAREAHCFDVNAEDEDEDEDVDSDLRAMNRQRNHSTFTANHSYANQHSSGGLTDEMVQRSYRASSLWADLFHIDHIDKSIAKRRLSDSNDQLKKRLHAAAVRKTKRYTNAELLEVARDMFKDQAFQWRSAAQSESMEMVLSGVEAAICILPTGGGKSLLFMLPLKLEDAQTTVIIVPLVSLRSDMIRRLRELRIRTEVWSPGTYPAASAVIVSAEAACSTEFMTYCQSLIATQRLDRIVVDECHLTVTQAGYRQSMRQLGSVRLLPTKFVYLTATLPPLMEPEFRRQNYLMAAKITRASANRPNISYQRVPIALPKEVSLVAAACDIIRNQIDMYSKTDSRLLADGSRFWNVVYDRVLIYCQSIDDATAVGSLLGCGVYTSSAGTAEQKEAIISEWLSNSRVPYLAATSALSAGFDYAHVRAVFHVDVPRSMIDFVQEVGRGGRDGMPAISAIIAQAGKARPSDDNSVDRSSMEKYMETSGCLRQFLSVYIDSKDCRAKRCSSRDSELCLVCIQARKGKHSVAPVAEEDVVGVVEEECTTGEREIRLQAKMEEEQIERFTENIQVLKDSCVACRLMGCNFDHVFNVCSRRWPFIHLKKSLPANWVAQYTCCFRCFMPQTICQSGYQQQLAESAEESHAQRECVYRDLVMPFCYFLLVADRDWVRRVWSETEHTRLKIEDTVKYMKWLGESVAFGGLVTTRAVSLMARRLTEFSLV